MSLLHSFVKLRPGHLAGAALALALLGGCTKNPDGPTVVVTPPAPEAPNAEARAYADYSDLKWSDEFDAPAIDQSKWGFDLGGGGWGNQELEFYTSSTDNAFINQGTLRASNGGILLLTGNGGGGFSSTNGSAVSAVGSGSEVRLSGSVTLTNTVLSTSGGGIIRNISWTCSGSSRTWRTRSTGGECRGCRFPLSIWPPSS